MPRITKHAKLVKAVYEQDKRARVSDAILVARVYAYYLGPEEYQTLTLRQLLMRIYKRNLPSPDTITRCGRLIRAEFPELDGGATSKQRRELERLVTLEDLGYSTKVKEDKAQLKLF